MKKINLTLAVVVLTAIASTFTACGGDTFTDPRDGQKYKTVKIGDQVWMAENLKYKATGYSCSNDDPEQCPLYGNMYSLGKLTEDPCPVGWHMPTKIELEELLSYIKKQYPDVGVGVALKSKNGWEVNVDNAEDKYGKRKGNGDDLVGFNAKPFPKGGFEMITLPTYWPFDTLIGTVLRRAEKFKKMENTFVLDRGVNSEYGKWKGGIRCVENSDFLAKKLIEVLLFGSVASFPHFKEFAHPYPDTITYLKESYDVYPKFILKLKESYDADSSFRDAKKQKFREPDSAVYTIELTKQLQNCPEGSLWKAVIKIDKITVNGEIDQIPRIKLVKPKNKDCDNLLSAEAHSFFDQDLWNIFENSAKGESIDDAKKIEQYMVEIQNKLEKLAGI